VQSCVESSSGPSHPMSMNVENLLHIFCTRYWYCSCRKHRYTCAACLTGTSESADFHLLAMKQLISEFTCMLLPLLQEPVKHRPPKLVQVVLLGWCYCKEAYRLDFGDLSPMPKVPRTWPLACLFTIPLLTSDSRVLRWCPGFQKFRQRTTTLNQMQASCELLTQAGHAQ